MKKLTSLAAYALMAPAITLGIGSAFAADSSTGLENAKEQRTTQEQRQMPQRAQNENGMATSDRAQEHRMGTDRMGMDRAKQDVNAHGTYLSSAPANSFGSDEVIGAELKSRSDNETIGEISDLIIGEDGQIAAVIVEVGGFLGLGEKEVAISWDSLERRSDDDGDDYYFSVDTTRDALNDAPGYENEDGIY